MIDINKKIKINTYKKKYRQLIKYVLLWNWRTKNNNKFVSTFSMHVQHYNDLLRSNTKGINV